MLTRVSEPWAASPWGCDAEPRWSPDGGYPTGRPSAFSCEARSVAICQLAHPVLPTIAAPWPNPTRNIHILRP